MKLFIFDTFYFIFNFFNIYFFFLNFVIYLKLFTSKKGVFVNFSSSEKIFSYVANEHNTEVTRFDLSSLFNFFEKYSKIGMKLFQELCIKTAILIKNVSQKMKLERGMIEQAITISDVKIPESDTNSSEIMYQRLFDLPTSEILISHSSCCMKGLVKVDGQIFVSQNFVCFSGKAFQKEVKKVIEMKNILNMKTNKQSKSIEINTQDKVHKFSDLVNLEDFSEMVLLCSSKCDKYSETLKTELSNSSQQKMNIEMSHWELIFGCSSKKQFKSGEVVLKDGEIDEHLYYISKGSCKIVKKLDEQSWTLEKLSTSTFFGEMGFLLGNLSSGDVICTEDSELFCFNTKELLKLFKRSSFLATKFFKHLLDILSDRFTKTFFENLTELL